MNCLALFMRTLSRHYNPGCRLTDLNEFDIKNEILACQWMIRIQYNRFFLYIYDSNRDYLS